MKTLDDIMTKQREYYESCATRDINFRLSRLKALEESILAHEEALYQAFAIDLAKGKTETYMAEISVVVAEIREMRKHLRSWMRPKRVRGTLGTFPGVNRIYHDPYGTVLILAPWNYPLLLTLSPLAGAIAAGNCAVVKCSKSAPNCAAVIKDIIDTAFEEKHVHCVDAAISYDEVLAPKYDYIFFTGSPRVGRQIMERAARDLIPVSLELGGKSPCFVTKDANLKMAAKRIAWGKLLNAGQTCISVDYILVDQKVKEEFIRTFRAEIELRYPDAAHNPEYPRIITEHHFNRLAALIEAERGAVLNSAEKAAEFGENSGTPGRVLGGALNAAERKIEPAIIADASFDSECMKEEIFGPIIPVIEYENLDDAVKIVNSKPHPLATYIFTEDKKLAQELLMRLPFGGGCINDTILHISNDRMPFGGVGNSGMGGYHGVHSFRSFTHDKSVVENTTAVDFPIRYAPFGEKKWKIIKKIL